LFFVTEQSTIIIFIHKKTLLFFCERTLAPLASFRVSGALDGPGKRLQAVSNAIRRTFRNREERKCLGETTCDP
jgi:hypothetical protein